MGVHLLLAPTFSRHPRRNLFRFGHLGDIGALCEGWTFSLQNRGHAADKSPVLPLNFYLPLNRPNVFFGLSSNIFHTAVARLGN